MTRRRGFTLIELLIVVAIIGIIVAIAVVNMINAIQRAKQKRSMADMKSLATAIEAYATDQNYYPAAAGYTLPSGLSLPTGTLGAVPGLAQPDVHEGGAARGRVELVFTYGTSPSQTDFVLRSAGADGPRDGSGLGRDDELQRRHHPRRRRVRAVSRTAPRGDRAAPARQTVARPARLLRQNFVAAPAFRPDSCPNQPDSGSRSARHAS